MFSWEKEEPKKPQKVGQAVYDILSKPQEDVQVQEVIDEYAKSYVKELEECVNLNAGRFGFPFHVVVLHKKEPWAVNVLRNWFTARKTAPFKKEMWKLFPNHGITVYEVKKDSCEVLWSLPTWQEAKVVLSNPQLYHPDLVKWCSEALQKIAM